MSLLMTVNRPPHQCFLKTERCLYAFLTLAVRLHALIDFHKICLQHEKGAGTCTPIDDHERQCQRKLSTFFQLRESGTLMAASHFPTLSQIYCHRNDRLSATITLNW